MSIATTSRSLRRTFGACSLLAAASVLAACGDDSSESVTLSLLAPEDGQVLTLEDDTDPSRPGVQFDVTGESTGLREQTPIELHIDGEPEGSTARVASDGSVTLSDVTMAPGSHTIYLVTSVGSVRSDNDHRYTLRALVIQDPEDGDELTEDQNESMDGFQVTVRVQGYALEGDDDVVLRVDGEIAGTAAPDEDGTATFENVTLEDGDHTLVARAGDVFSEEVDITVESTVEPPPPDCDGVGLLAPSSPSGPIVLGGAACEDGAVTTDVEVEVDQPDGTSVALELNGARVGEGEVSDGAVTFDDVAIEDASGNELTLVIGDVECEVNELDIVIDCDAPNCLLRAPEPVLSGDTLYFGQAQEADDGGFDVEVETDAEAEGEEVALVIDGDEANAITVDAAQLGGDIVAVFAGVELADGEHTVRASCRDAVGNVETTPDLEVVIDTVACDVAITAPMADAIYLPGDDVANAAGIQVGGIAAVTGSGCVQSRSGLCEAGGSPDADFATFDGESPYTSLLTLDDTSTAQTYCVEIRDVAGNVGRDEVSFMLRQVAPMVLIESPATGTSFNAAGDATHTADAVPATALCDAEFVVACEVGSMVELHRDSAAGALIGSAPCVQDNDAPTGFTGRAEITAEIGEALGDESATVVATQTFAGTSASLTGVSAPVTLATDCQAPVIVEGQTPCSLHASDQITLVEAADFEIELGDSSSDTESAALAYWIGGDVTDPLGDPTATQTGIVSGGGSMIAFDAIDFGGEGPLVVTATLEDDFGNVATYECESEIVAELPSITVVTWPDDGAEYGPGDSECDPEGAAEYGIEIEVTIDNAEDREASLIVNGEVVDDDVMIDETTIALCVAVPSNSENTPEGPTTIRLRVEETVGNGFDFVEREINVRTIEITDPQEDQLIATDDDCDPGAGFGYLVTVEFDPMHVGEDYRIVADGAAVTGTVADTAPVEACVEVTLGGERTFTASIDDSDIEHSVTVTVVDDTPEIVSIDAPLDGETFGVNEGCVPAMPNRYGVLVEATVDQDENREADILVNGALVADNVPIASDGTLARCVAVPDNLDNGDASTTITLSLSSTIGSSTPATASVDIDVDTLVIVDPAEDDLLTAVDDCDTGRTGIDYEVELAVDPSHLGRMYTITDGTAPATGVIADDTITACVALSTGTRQITASIGGTMITESVVVDVEAPAPSILAITAPTSGQMFGPGGESCDTGTTSYGVRVQATVDQDEDRIVTVAVNGGTPIAAPISGSNTIDVCAPVPDNRVNGGSSSIVVRLEEEPGDRFDTETVMVSVDLLNITAPTAGQLFTPLTDCTAGPGFGVPVSIAVDPSLAGQTYVINAGLADLTGTVGASPITGCVAASNATTMLTASISGTPITESVAITVFTGPPTTGIAFTSECPDTSSPSYREDPVTLTWGDLSSFEDYEGQFQSLELRCAHTTVGSATTPDAWWTAATVTPLPGGTTAASTGADIAYRVGETRHCVLRATNINGLLTPMSSGTNVTCGFRSTLLHLGTVAGANLGTANAPIGDVNGDGIDDLLVGGIGRALLFLGRTTPFTGSPDTVFVTTAASPATSLLGFRVAGLGDINGDGLQDFAVAEPGFNADLATARGRIYVFLGRATWPSSVTLGTACGADYCFDHTENAARVGAAVAGAGDFDGDAVDDIVVGAATYPAGASLGQLFVLRGGAYERRACTMPSECRSNETCTAGSCTLNTGETFWGLQFELPSGNWVNTPSGTPSAGYVRGFVLAGVMGTEHSMGRGIAALGAFDAAPGADLAVAATGRASGPAVQAKLFFLSGRPHSGAAGLDTLTISDLGFRDGMGTPSGTPFHATTTGMGIVMAATGNVYDVPGAGAPGVRDLLVKRPTDAGFYIYPGDRNFNSADRIGVTGLNASDLGASITMGYAPALPPNPALDSPDLLTDFNGDGVSDFVAGARGIVAGQPGQALLFYGDVVSAANIVGGNLSHTRGSPIEPAGSAGTDYQTVEAAGDLNDDGHPDIVVGHREVNAGAGEAYLLY